MSWPGLLLDGPEACECRRWECPPGIAPDAFRVLRNRLVLDHGKWDPQVGDVGTIAPFPLILPAGVVRRLGGLAERLAAEATAAEHEIAGRPDLVARLGLPRRVRRLFDGCDGSPAPGALRVIRFDFHPTPDGWRISEANSDVPGGYVEASDFPRLMAGHYPGTAPAGDPAAALVDAIVACAGGAGPVALLSAPGYMEDQQVTAALAARLRQRGTAAHLARPEQVRWREGRARLETHWYEGPLGAVVRFYQGEWLGGGTRSEGFFRSSVTPVCNPGTALLSESKRFPLTWDSLRAHLPTWRALLPPTLDPRRAPWRGEPGWVLKAALCNNGDAVAARGLVDGRAWKQAAVGATLRPGSWVAQRRFEATSIPTPAGPMYPCLGVYVIDGEAAGIYGRIAPRPLIDHEAIDVAVLIREEEASRER